MNIFIANIQGQKAELRSDESWHCAKVLRKKTGDAIRLIDGSGFYYEAVLETVSDKRCIAVVQGPGTFQKPSNYYLHLAIAPTKNIDRIEWMLEKCVEIGIQEISFFISKNSERQVLKMDRIVGIVESAVKQSLQTRIPIVHPLADLKSILSANWDAEKWLAHCEDADKTNIRTINFNEKKNLILIGPEGDFTPAEVKLALDNGFKGLSLGENRLRTETAGLYVCQAANLLSHA